MSCACTNFKMAYPMANNLQIFGFDFNYFNFIILIRKGVIIKRLLTWYVVTATDKRFKRFKNGLFDETSIHFMSAPWHNIHLHQGLAKFASP